jgi:membrane protein implicated in regulation of membrane protease activity
MESHWMWWIAAGVLIAAELFTGTFYLLAIGLALACGGIASLVGASIEVQWLIAAVCAFAFTLVAHRWRLAHGRPPPVVPYDVGQSVRVQSWSADGTARVDYRGTQWTAVLATPETPRAESMVIVAIRGSNLVLADRVA